MINKIPLTSGVARAQNFSVSQLNYKSDLKNAKVSVADDGNHSPVISVADIGRENNLPTTSVARALQKETNTDNSTYNEDADERRYNYMRAQMRKKKVEEQKKAEKTAVSKPTAFVNPQTAMKIRSGGGFRVAGVLGLKRHLYQMVRQNPAHFKNISAADRQYFIDTLRPHASAVRVGTGINRLARKEMRYKFLSDYRKGKISKADYDDFKRMVNSLPHQGKD